MVVKSIDAVPDKAPDIRNHCSRDPDLGVLFVHGIGHQKLGDTLDWAGEPLFRWLKDWFECDPNRPDKPENAGRAEDEHRVYLTDTSVARPVPASRLWFRQSGEASPQDPNWIVAESFWAEEFAPPTFAELVTFGLGLAPVLIERTGLQVLGGLFRVLRSRLAGIEPGEGIFRRLLVPMQRIVVEVSALLFTFLGFFLLLFTSALVQVLILTLYLLGFFPPLRDFVLRIQLYLAGWLGDAYLVAASPLRYDAMVSKVRRDLDWLLRAQPDRGPCKAIAVVAHSGGTIIAHEALTGPQSEKYRTLDKPALLITYGSGHSKEDTIQKLQPKRGFIFTAAQVTRVFLSVVTLALFIFLMTPQPFLVLSPLELQLIVVATIAIQAILLSFGGRINKIYAIDPFRPEKPAGLEWKDYLAVADIVPDKPIIPKSDDATITKEVYNLHSLREDHGAYWQNGEEFVADVVSLLYNKANQKDLACDPRSQETFIEAQRRRKNRVNSYFGAGLITFWTLPLLWFGMGPVLGQIGSPFRDTVLGFLPKVVSDYKEIVQADQFWNTVIGGAVVAFGVYLWHQWVLRRLWNWWTRNEEKTMFNRNMQIGKHRPFTWLRTLLFPLMASSRKKNKLEKDPSAEVKSAAAWFLLMSSLLPLVAILVAFLVGSISRFDVWNYLLVALALALFMSRFTWAIIAWTALWRQPTEGIGKAYMHRN